jgi:hypothetical protein
VAVTDSSGAATSGSDGLVEPGGVTTESIAEGEAHASGGNPRSGGSPAAAPTDPETLAGPAAGSSAGAELLGPPDQGGDQGAEQAEAAAGAGQELSVGEG